MPIYHKLLNSNVKCVDGTMKFLPSCNKKIICPYCCVNIPPAGVPPSLSLRGFGRHLKEKHNLSSQSSEITDTVLGSQTYIPVPDHLLHPDEHFDAEGAPPIAGVAAASSEAPTNAAPVAETAETNPPAAPAAAASLPQQQHPVEEPPPWFLMYDKQQQENNRLLYSLLDQRKPPATIGLPPSPSASTETDQEVSTDPPVTSTSTAKSGETNETENEDLAGLDLLSLQKRVRAAKQVSREVSAQCLQTCLEEFYDTSPMQEQLSSFVHENKPEFLKISGVGTKNFKKKANKPYQQVKLLVDYFMATDNGLASFPPGPFLSQLQQNFSTFCQQIFYDPEDASTADVPSTPPPKRQKK